MKNIDLAKIACPHCGARHSLSTFASYNRHLVTYENNKVSNNILTISRYICSSCGKTHAILPSVIIPYLSFSFKYTISIIHDYLIHKFKTVEDLCSHYCISISTFYRILRKFKEHKKIWLGLLEANTTSDLSFTQKIINESFIKIESFILDFFLKNNLSFFQRTS